MANNYNTYNPYNGNIYMQEMQSMKDRIDKQMQQYQQSQNQFMQQQQQQQQQQQPQIQQTFQLSNPNQNITDFDGKYAETIDEVKNTLVYKNSIFVNKNMDKMWVKDAGGNIRIFNLQEEIQVDENVAEINNLKQEVGELKALLIQQLQAQKTQQEVIEPEPKSQIVGKIQPVTKVERKVK